MTCKHPHIFRLTPRDPYHCLACGEVMAVIPYSELDQSSTLMVLKRRMPAKKGDDG